jgi:hypothetical protein
LVFIGAVPRKKVVRKISQIHLGTRSTWTTRRVLLLRNSNGEIDVGEFFKVLSIWYSAGRKMREHPEKPANESHVSTPRR